MKLVQAIHASSKKVAVCGIINTQGEKLILCVKEAGKVTISYRLTIFDQFNQHICQNKPYPNVKILYRGLSEYFHLNVGSDVWEPLKD